MANKRKPMSKIIDIVKHIENGLNNSEIKRLLKLDRKTIREYRERIADSRITYSVLKNMDEDQAFERVFGKKNTRLDDERYSQLDFEYLRKELKREKVTLQLLWDEYIESNPGGYQYTQFCKHYSDFEKKLNFSYRKMYKWGEIIFVDYAGQTVPISDPATGEISPAYIFVGILAASNYTYAEATAGKTTKDWIQCHCNAFDYFDGVPEIVTPDNDTALVKKAHKYEPVINENYKSMADHYGVCVLPTRVRKPKDKAKVESAVLLVERWILASIRNRQYFSIDELNDDIFKLLQILNTKEFKKIKGTRLSQFEEYEKPMLRPLPKIRYEYFERTRATVYIDYHVKVHDFYYSVPCNLVGEVVDVQVRPMTITILHKNKQIYSHLRSFSGHRFITVDEHMPRSHQEYKKWTPERILNWAASIDPFVQKVIDKIFDKYKHPALGFRSAMGIISLSKKYSVERLSKACQRALEYSAPNCTRIENILKNNLDNQNIYRNKNVSSLTQDHENIRGPEYYKN